jgi:hypothetical protein
MNEAKKTSLEPNTNSIKDGIDHEPGGGKALINPAGTLLLLLESKDADPDIPVLIAAKAEYAKLK